MHIAIIQARLGSTRLPGKIFMDFAGKPDLLRVYERVSLSKYIDKVIIATTLAEPDGQVAEFCKKNQMDCFRGSELDVLDRYYQCAVSLNLNENDVVVRITADCPVIDPEVIDQAINFFMSGAYDYVSNTQKPTFPDGLDVEVFAFSTLKKAWENADKESEREHVTPYIYSHPEQFRLFNFENEIDLSHYRLTLDRKDDYELIKMIYDNLYEDGKTFYLKDIHQLLTKHPEYCEINNHINRNEGIKAPVSNDQEIN